MDWLDICIILVALISIRRGFQVGFLRQLASTVGFVGGLFAGSFIANMLSPHIGSANFNVFISFGLPVLCAFICMTLAEIIAFHAKRRVESQTIHSIDGVFGSGMALITLCIGLWLASTLLLLGPSSGLQRQLQHSAIITGLNKHLPSANQLITSLNKLIDPNTAPQVFAGQEPSPDATYPAPNLGQFGTALANSRQSIVKVEGLGCGGIVNGSGFVYAKNRVATNAHVIAGVQNPKVTDSNGTHGTRVVWFDRDNDLAVLEADNLAGQPLRTQKDVQAPGTAILLAGFPGGGDFTTQTGVVLDNFNALGRDIYGQGRTMRHVYALQSQIVKGNSGGPVLNTNGYVIGIVFATSTTYNNVGYALTMSQVADSLRTAATSSVSKDTGTCSE